MARLTEAAADVRNVCAFEKPSAIIYCLKDPRDQAIKYVGVTVKALKDRLHVHLACAKRNSDRPVCAWISELAELDLQPLAEVLEDVSLGCSGYEREVHWIRFLREQGMNLLNCTDGGPGWTGHRHSPAELEKIGAANRGKVIGAAQREKISRAMTGKKLSDDHKARVSAAMKGRVFSDQTRQRISDAKRGRPAPKTCGSLNGRAVLTPEYVLSIREGLIGVREAMATTGISKSQFYRVRRGEQWRSAANG